MDACLSLLSSAVLDESRPMSVMGLARSAAVRVSVARRALTQFAVDQVARVAATVAVSVVDDTTGMLNVVLVGDSALGGLPGRIVSAQVYGVEPRIEGSSPADRDLRALTQRQASALQAAQPHDPVIQPSAAIERTASAPVPVAPPAASAPMPKRKPDEPAKPAPAPKKAKEESAAMRAFLSRGSVVKKETAQKPKANGTAPPVASKKGVAVAKSKSSSANRVPSMLANQSSDDDDEDDDDEDERDGPVDDPFDDGESNMADDPPDDVRNDDDARKEDSMEEDPVLPPAAAQESPAKEDAAPVDSTVRKLVKNTVQETYKKGKYLGRYISTGLVALRWLIHARSCRRQNRDGGDKRSGVEGRRGGGPF